MNSLTYYTLRAYETRKHRAKAAKIIREYSKEGLDKARQDMEEKNDEIYSGLNSENPEGLAYYINYEALKLRSANGCA